MEQTALTQDTSFQTTQPQSVQLSVPIMQENLDFSDLLSVVLGNTQQIPKYIIVLIQTEVCAVGWHLYWQHI